MDILFICIGVVALYFGGEYLVKGSSGLSLRYGLSPMIVGLTVVAFGTSAPELFVSLQSALTGHAEIAFGNVVGSNIANILLILGAPALIYPIAAHNCEGGIRAWVEMMFASILVVPLLVMSPFGWPQGMILLMFFAAIIFFQLTRAKSGEISLTDEIDESDAELPLTRILALIAAGIILLPLGANRLVAGASNIAHGLGISEEVIGLSIVAIGTSLPELATSLNAAFKKETDMAIGNVLGSNLFNILLILGVTGMAATTTIEPNLLVRDTTIMLLAAALIGVFMLGKITISRSIGIVMLAAYVSYLIFCFMTGSAA